jgi:CHAT domain-containing protein
MTPAAIENAAWATPVVIAAAAAVAQSPPNDVPAKIVHFASSASFTTSSLARVRSFLMFSEFLIALCRLLMALSVCH